MFSNVNKEYLKQLTKTERFSLLITTKVGTLGSFLLIVGWTVVWLGWNLLAPDEYKFDTAPTFLAWLFISNVIQICLMPLIMIGQNVQAKHAQLRADHHYQSDIDANIRLDMITKMMVTLNKTSAEIHTIAGELKTQKEIKKENE